MRKLFTLLAFVATISTWAARFEVDGIYYSTLDESSVEVTYQKRLSSSNYSKSFGMSHKHPRKIPQYTIQEQYQYAVSVLAKQLYNASNSAYRGD